MRAVWAWDRNGIMRCRRLEYATGKRPSCLCQCIREYGRHFFHDPHFIIEQGMCPGRIAMCDGLCYPGVKRRQETGLLAKEYADMRKCRVAIWVRFGEDDRVPGFDLGVRNCNSLRGRATLRNSMDTERLEMGDIGA